MTDDPEDRDPGLARARTELAWVRTAIAFAAVGGVILKSDVVPGLIVIALAPVVWQLGRMPRTGPGVRARFRLITAAIVAVAAVALVLSVLVQGHGPYLR